MKREMGRSRAAKMRAAEAGIAYVSPYPRKAKKQWCMRCRTRHLATTPHDDGRCPKCGGELFRGYGLMGGGIGVYEGCQEDGCDYFTKEQDGAE